MIAEICAEILNFKRSVGMKFYKSVKFKALAGALLLAAILCAIFIRVIPDYSTSRGFAIVSTFTTNTIKDTASKRIEFYPKRSCIKER